MIAFDSAAIHEVWSRASAGSATVSKLSIRSPNAVPWAQPEVRVRFFSLSS